MNVQKPQFAALSEKYLRGQPIMAVFATKEEAEQHANAWIAQGISEVRWVGKTITIDGTAILGLIWVVSGIANSRPANYEE